MRLSSLKEIESSKIHIDVFKGYNHNLRIADGEFFDMYNLSSDNYPVISPRKIRGIFSYDGNPQAMIAKSEFCYIDGEDIVIGDKRIPMGFTSGDKQLVSMGAYIIVFPDKKYINTLDVEDRGDIDEVFESGGDVEFSLCRLDGSGYDGVVISPSAPENPQNLSHWLDTSVTPNTLKQWSSANDMWVNIPTTYIKIRSDGIGAKFSVNDGIKISGIKIESLKEMNDTATVIWGKGDDYIIVTGLLDKVASQTGIAVKREIPDMDFVVESENRLWGCKYGQVNGKMVNEIYASKLGDFKNWNCFMGISTDSYVASIGTDGDFTGAITFAGHPIFFKENWMHKVYGNYPSNYQINTTACRGVKKGSHKSLAIVNEVCYYQSRNSICFYDGSLPQECSYPLGNIQYGDGVACACGNKYYISMRDLSKGEWVMFVYDSSLGVWHKEDDTHVKDFCLFNGELYFIDIAKSERLTIKTMFGSGKVIDEERIKWMAETGVIGINFIEQKYVSKINIRTQLELNSVIRVFIEYDSSGEWELVYRVAGSKLQSFTIPVKPRRCDHIKIRLEGEGNAKIYSITKTIEGGSDEL